MLEIKIASDKIFRIQIILRRPKIIPIIIP